MSVNAKGIFVVKGDEMSPFFSSANPMSSCHGVVGMAGSKLSDPANISFSSTLTEGVSIAVG
jgi:hypothetical protein